MARDKLTVLHISDLQCGKPFVPRAAEALLRLASRVRPDVIVVAGDLTQRAKAREFQMALKVLEELPDVPIITTPGNHDVPLYRVWERIFTPFRNWHRFVSPDLDTVTRLDGATFVALSSAAPRRAIVNGRIDPAQLEFACDVFERARTGDLRCLVIHHHLVPLPDREGGRPLPRSHRLLATIEAAGVDVVLGGHVHRVHVTTSRDLLTEREGPGVPLVACGTTTSRRGRGPEAGWNSLNVVTLSGSTVEVTPYHLEPGATAFEKRSTMSFPRPRVAEATAVTMGGEAE